MELSLTTIFFLIVAFAVGAAVMLFMIGQWLDLTGLRYVMESHRNALNLLQLIVTNSPLVEGYPLRPNKLILEEAELNSHEYTGLSGDYDMYDEANLNDLLHGCCQFLDFDYKITVIDLAVDPPRVWNIGNIPFKTDSECYPDRFVGYADMPVVVHRNGGSYNPGFIDITLVKTPLSDLSFWLSQSFIRADWSESRSLFEEKSEVMVPIDPEIETISIDKEEGTVCMTFRGSGKTACKSFIITSAALGPTDPVNINILDECSSVWITTDMEFQKVTVS